jgi:hypothetical protein
MPMDASRSHLVVFGVQTRLRAAAPWGPDDRFPVMGQAAADDFRALSPLFR